jgi:hypothetical protein
MKTKICLLGTFAIATLAIAAPQTWTFTTGKTFDGDYYSSGTTAVVIRNNGTNYIFKMADLSANDLAYVSKIQAYQKQLRLDAEVKQMAQAGLMEFSAKLVEHFPEKVLPYQKGWMDVTFNDLSQNEVEASELEVGLFVTDKNDDSFFSATIFKQLNRPELNTPAVPNPLATTVLNFKHGDKIRLIGHCYPKFSDSIHEAAGTPDRAGFLVEKIEIIETAAEKKAREQAEQQAEQQASQQSTGIDSATGLPLNQK